MLSHRGRSTVEDESSGNILLIRSMPPFVYNVSNFAFGSDDTYHLLKRTSATFTNPGADSSPMRVAFALAKFDRRIVFIALFSDDSFF
jgi:hypothetical protein